MTMSDDCKCERLTLVSETHLKLIQSQGLERWSTDTDKGTRSVLYNSDFLVTVATNSQTCHHLLLFISEIVPPPPPPFGHKWFFSSSVHLVVLPIKLITALTVC